MLTLLKVLFFILMAVVVGVFIGTVPIQGRTVAERIEEYCQPALRLKALVSGKLEASRSEPSRSGPRSTKARRSPPPAASTAPSTSVEAPASTAGRANMPDGASDEDRSALDRIIATHAKR
jgi:hypothetical protein